MTDVGREGNLPSSGNFSKFHALKSNIVCLTFFSVCKNSHDVSMVDGSASESAGTASGYVFGMPDNGPDPGYYAHLTYNAPLSGGRARRLVAALAATDPRTVLDVGCGWGELLLELLIARRSRPASGRWPSARQLERSGRRSNPAIWRTGRSG